ncbi:arabinan endo-1,5-alpha-L-arabinosidase, partial [Phenoliferia sp. Uapishka_3]
MRPAVAFLALLTAVSSMPLNVPGPASLVRRDANPDSLTGDTTGVHDPTLVKTPEGSYLLFGSGGWYTAKGVSVGTAIPTWSSPDQKAWTYLGTAFATSPSETDHYTGVTNGDLWAPDVTYVNGKYWMYYAASSSGSRISGIFLATSTTGLPGSWTDDGLVTSTDDGHDWNALDPHLIIEGNAWYLSVGSYWTGIKLLSLNPSDGKLDGSVVVDLAERTEANGAIEGSFIHFQAPYYYLFTSWDNCCNGPDATCTSEKVGAVPSTSTYAFNPTDNIRVVRSDSITGPYQDENGTAALSGGGRLVLGSHDDIKGPGGQSLLSTSDGLKIVYHYLTDGTSVANLGIDDITWGTEDWPNVA